MARVINEVFSVYIYSAYFVKLLLIKARNLEKGFWLVTVALISVTLLSTRCRTVWLTNVPLCRHFYIGVTGQLLTDYLKALRHRTVAAIRFVCSRTSPGILVITFRPDIKFRFMSKSTVSYCRWFS